MMRSKLSLGEENAMGIIDIAVVIAVVIGIIAGLVVVVVSVSVVSVVIF